MHIPTLLKKKKVACFLFLFLLKKLATKTAACLLQWALPLQPRAVSKDRRNTSAKARTLPQKILFLEFLWKKNKQKQAKDWFNWTPEQPWTTRPLAGQPNQSKGEHSLLTSSIPVNFKNSILKKVIPRFCRKVHTLKQEGFFFPRQGAQSRFIFSVFTAACVVETFSFTDQHDRASFNHRVSQLGSLPQEAERSSLLK